MRLMFICFIFVFSNLMALPREQQITLNALMATETGKKIESNTKKKIKNLGLDQLAVIALLVQKKIKYKRIIIDVNKQSIGYTIDF